MSYLLDKKGAGGESLPTNQMVKIKEVRIEITLFKHGDAYETLGEYVSRFKHSNTYKALVEENGIIDVGDGDFDIDNLDEDINVIRFINALMMEGYIDLNQENWYDTKVIRE